MSTNFKLVHGGSLPNMKCVTPTIVTFADTPARLEASWQTPVRVAQRFHPGYVWWGRKCEDPTGSQIFPRNTKLTDNTWLRGIKIGLYASVVVCILNSSVRRTNNYIRLIQVRIWRNSNPLGQYALKNWWYRLAEEEYRVQGRDGLEVGGKNHSKNTERHRRNARNQLQ